MRKVCRSELQTPNRTLNTTSLTQTSTSQHSSPPPSPFQVDSIALPCAYLGVNGSGSGRQVVAGGGKVLVQLQRQRAPPCAMRRVGPRPRPVLGRQRMQARPVGQRRVALGAALRHKPARRHMRRQRVAGRGQVRGRDGIRRRCRRITRRMGYGSSACCCRSMAWLGGHVPWQLQVPGVGLEERAVVPQRRLVPAARGSTARHQSTRVMQRSLQRPTWARTSVVQPKRACYTLCCTS